MEKEIRPSTADEREYCNRNVTQEDILQLARMELQSLNEVMDNVLQIPVEVFREVGHSGLSLAMAKHVEERGVSERFPVLGNAVEELDRLCAATPNTPRDAVDAFSLAYMGLVSLFFDERFKPHLSGVGALNTLMLIREQKGYVLGMVTGTSSAQSEAGKAARAIFAKSGADVRHKENHAMKADAFKWLDGNFDNCKSMDSAAEIMAGKLVPATFRTVRGWVTEWKKLRPASTP